MAKSPPLESDSERSSEPFDHERFKNYAGAVQSIVISLVVLSAGVWAISQAQASREDRSSEHAQQVATDEAARISVFNVTLEAMPPEVVGTDRYIRFDATIENIGSSEALIHFGSSDSQPLSVVRVERSPFGNEAFTWTRATPVQRYFLNQASSGSSGGSAAGGSTAGGSTVSFERISRPGQIIELEFLAAVDEPGVYLGTLRFTTQDQEIVGAPALFVATTYVVVPEGQE